MSEEQFGLQGVLLRQAVPSVTCVFAWRGGIIAAAQPTCRRASRGRARAPGSPGSSRCHGVPAARGLPSRACSAPRLTWSGRSRGHPSSCPRAAAGCLGRAPMPLPARFGLRRTGRATTASAARTRCGADDMAKAAWKPRDREPRPGQIFERQM